MANVFYTRMTATATRMIAKYGMPATVRRTNPTTGVVTSLPTKVLIVTTVQKVLGDSAIQIGDDELLMQSGVTPQHGDRILYGTENRVIVQPVNATNPGGSVIYTQCFARKG